MKTFLIFILLCVSSLSTVPAFSQAVDMAIDNPNMSPSPTSFPGKTTISFDFQAEQGTHQLSSDDLASNFMVINVTLGKLDGTGVQPTGAGADLFTWTFNTQTGVFQGVSKDVLVLEDVIYPIIFADLKTTVTSTANDVGFKVNMVPPGDLLNSVPTDDKTELFTSAPLPVTLVSFSVAREGQKTNLAWVTTAETNSDRFDVEHSVNGKNWTQIGTITANGESSTQREYTFVDKDPVKGANYYRLKMLDIDATYTYSRIQSITFEGIPSVTLYPNPVSDVLYLKDVALETVKSVSIISTGGATVYNTGSANSQPVSSAGFNVSALSDGIYIVKITQTNGTQYTHKIVISR